MKFEINGCKWTIKEVEQKDIKDFMQKRYENQMEDEPSKSGRYYGITYHDDQLILIDKDLHPDRKRKTLIHELSHCYIGCYITHIVQNYEEEDVCDIVSNSHEIIHKIVTSYFKK